MKLKFSSDTLLLTKANKALSRHYAETLKYLNRDALTVQEIVGEAKSVIRKWEDAPFLVNLSFYSALEKSDWEKIAAMKP